MDEAILLKVKKLLALSKSDNEHESASAMAQVERLMEKHNITQAMLIDSQKNPEYEEIRVWEDPLYASEGKNRSQWRSCLALGLARANACEVYTQNANIFIVGRADDVQTVRYLFDYCQREIERLSKRFAGNGKGWISNYKMGVVQAIRDKMNQAREATRKEMVSEYGQQATNAIVRLDDKAALTKKFFDNISDLKFKSQTFGKQSHHGDARARGYNDGKNINVESGRGLGDGHKRLPGN